MKKLLSFLCAACLLAGCYDTLSVQERLDGQAARLDALEQACSAYNANITALQKILAAVQQNDFVTSMTPVMAGGSPVGYTLVFATAGPVTIYHGRNGADGRDGSDGKDGRNGKDGRDGADGEDGRDGRDGDAPVVGVRIYGDIWYWTLNGDWLLDAEGNKVKAIGVDGRDGVDGTDGTDGADAIAPMLNIVDGFWYLSIDGGQSWMLVGKATGADGTNGTNGTNGNNGSNGADGDSMFSSIVESGGVIQITLTGGTVVTVPTSNPLSISFKVFGGALNPDNPVIIPKNYSALNVEYTVTSNTKAIDVAVVSSEDMGTRLLADPADPRLGTIQIASGMSIEDKVSKVIVLVSDGTHTLMRSLTFDAMTLYPDASQASSVNVNHKHQTLIYKMHTNYPFTVQVPAAAKSWIHIISTKTTEEYNIKMTVDENENQTTGRSADILIKNAFNAADLKFTINQQANPVFIVFEDSNLKIHLINQGVDTNGDGEISMSEAAAITSLETLLGHDPLFVSSNFTSFNEFQYFIGITTIPAGSFRNWTKLTSITLPQSITTIDMDFDATTDDSIFRNCPLLTHIAGKYANSYENALVYNKKLVKVAEKQTVFAIPPGVDTVVRYAFYNSMIEEVTIPESVKVIGESAFEFSKIKEVAFPTDSYGDACIKKIEEKTFAHCYKLTGFYGPTAFSGLLRVTSDHRFVAVDSTLYAYALGAAETQAVIQNDFSLKRMSDYLFDVVGMDGNPLPASEFTHTLETIALPSSTTRIGEHTFRNCEQLTKLYFKSAFPPYGCGANAFSGCNSGWRAYLNVVSDMVEFSAALHVPMFRIQVYDSWPF